MAELTQHSILRITDAKTMQLVELFKQEECLWNVNHCDHRSKSIRAQSYLRIANELNIPHFGQTHAMSKIKNLRNAYCQELKKMLGAAGNGMEYRPKVPWFPIMDSFLRPFLQSLPLKQVMRSQNSNQELETAVNFPKENAGFETEGNVMSHSETTVTASDGTLMILKEDREVKEEVWSDPEDSGDCEYVEIPVKQHVEIGSQIPTYIFHDVTDTFDAPTTSNMLRMADKRVTYESPKSLRKTKEVEEINFEAGCHRKRCKVEVLESDDVPRELVKTLNSIAHNLHNLTGNKEKEDHFDIFGRYIATLLRGIPIEKASILQPKILQMIMTDGLMKSESIVTQSDS